MSPVYFVALIAQFTAPPAGPKSVDFESQFGQYKGTFVLKEIGGREWVRYGGESCKTRLSPCSTFKIPNALIGLETGVLKDENTLFKWDGKPQHFKTWERDHTLASAIKESCVWYFQEVARRIGQERMKSYIDKLDYATHLRGSISFGSTSR
jgi:bla regulator protein BlaR1